MSSRDIIGQVPSVESTSESGERARRECPECSGEVRTEVGETVCEDCGLVVAESQIDHGPEWRACERKTRKRTGAPITTARHDRGLSTEIGRGRDANGNTLSPGKRRQMSRLRREHNRGRWRTKAERNLALGLTHIRRIVACLDLPKTIREQASALFRKAQKEGLFRGRSIEGMAGGSVYAVCRCSRLPRSLEEVAAYAQCDHSKVENDYRVLNAELELPTEPPLAQDYIPRIAGELDVSDQIRRRAVELVEEAKEAGLVNGCRPSGFAAASLYLAAKEEGSAITQQEVADPADVSTATVRSNRDTIQEYLS